MDNLPIGIIDIIVIALVIMSGLLAYFRGFIRELLSIAAWVGAVAAGFYGYGLLAPHLSDFIRDEDVANVAAGLGIGVVALVALSVLASMVSSSVQESHAGSVDRALGFVFGIGRGLLILSLVYLGTTHWFIEEQDLPDVVQESRALPVAKASANFVTKLLPEDIRAKIVDADRQREEEQKKLEALRNLAIPKPAGASDDDGTQPPAYGDKERQQLDSLLKEAE